MEKIFFHEREGVHHFLCAVKNQNRKYGEKQEKDEQICEKSGDLQRKKRLTKEDAVPYNK